MLLRSTAAAGATGRGVWRRWSQRRSFPSAVDSRDYGVCFPWRRDEEKEEQRPKKEAGVALSALSGGVAGFGVGGDSAGTVLDASSDFLVGEMGAPAPPSLWAMGSQACPSAEVVEMVAADGAGGADVTVGTPLPAPETAAVVADAADALSPLSYTNPPDLALMFLEYVHVTTGLPWWATIVSVTVGLRTLLVPLMVGSMANTAKMAVMKPEMNLIMQRMQNHPKKDDQKVVQGFRKEIKALQEKHGCYPIRSLLPILAQIPIFMSMFFALRKISDYYPDMATGGPPGTFAYDLSLTDQSGFYALPVAAAVFFLGTIEMGGETGDPEQQRNMKNVMRGLGVVSVPMMAMFPQAIFMYWLPSNAFSFCQVALLRQPAIKRAVGIPDIPPHILKANAEAPTPSLFPSAAPAARAAESPLPQEGVPPPPPPPDGTVEAGKVAMAGRAQKPAPAKGNGSKGGRGGRRGNKRKKR